MQSEGVILIPYVGGTSANEFGKGRTTQYDEHVVCGNAAEAETCLQTRLASLYTLGNLQGSLPCVVGEVERKLVSSPVWENKDGCSVITSLMEKYYREIENV